MKTKIGLLYGGKSAEHQVSLQTALAVIRALDMEKFEVNPIYITTKGEWIKGPQLHEPVDRRASTSVFCRRCFDSIIIPFANAISSGTTNK